VNLRKAVLVDPHPLWLNAVQEVLHGSSVEVVGRAASTKDGVGLVQEHQPELLVTEIADAAVAEYVEEVRRSSPSTRVVVLSAVEDRDVVDAALRAGATAYVIKTALPDDFAAAVRQVFSHSVYLPGPNGNGPRLEPRPDHAVATHELTRRELEILQLVAEGAPNSEVARKLWITQQTVKFHLSNIYKKLGVANRTEAASWAQRQGLLADGSTAGAYRNAPRQPGSERAARRAMRLRRRRS
jgi:DNA-binding NarL/FixJ family response regulator